ncbi:MAG TPA: MBL fold metallo-hydrolase [Gemmatimonadales bacterium]|nr:MBL fold metallo-hydrolase [Gemmatimonadales bacterium]
MPRPEVITLTNGAFVENCYLVIDRARGEAVIVDPGEDAALFLDRLRAEDVTLTGIWLTHAHLDHVLGVARVADATGVDIWLHPADRPLYDHIPDQAAVWMQQRVAPPPPPQHALAAGDVVTVGTHRFAVRHVPGHSPGSVAFVGHGMAFVGDALFAGSVGRVDLPGGDGAALLESITDQLLTLPDETVVYSGHGPATTIGQERASNPFLTGEYRLV